MLSKKLKKVTSVIIAVFLSMSLVACGGDYVNETIDTANLINPAESFDKSASIEETVLADKSGIKITAKSLTYSGYKVIINLLMENNSGNDVSILSNTLACSSNSVNSYMINIIEGLNRQFRKITKNKPSFTNDDSLRKILYLASKNIVSHWSATCRNWDVVSDQLSIMFADRKSA